MISASSDPSGSPVMRTVYLRASTKTSALVPAPAEVAAGPASDDGVVNLVNRTATATPPAESLPGMDGGDRPAAWMELLVWQTAQGILADPMQAMVAQRAPAPDSIAVLVGNRFRA